MACAQCGKPSRGIELDHGNNPFYVGDYFSPPRVELCGCSEGAPALDASIPALEAEDPEEAINDEEPGAPIVPKFGQLVSREVTVKSTSGEHTLKTARFVNNFKSSPNNPFDITSKVALPNVKKIVTQRKRVDLSSEKESRSIWDILKDVDLPCQPRFLWDTEMVFKDTQVIEDHLETKTEIVITKPPECTDPSSDNSSLASFSSAVSELSPIEPPKVEIVTTKTRTTKFLGPQMSPNNPFDVNEKPARKVDLAAIRFGMCIRGRKYPARMEDLIDGSPLKPRLLSFQ
ncbi:hypothetical protein K493DRAFT_338129 [Basidiobolus meristosporus CBS 931.73]|uniref:Uncharacterized protein n=1 Tax=Basidiobolus meristosporus CBS 931.73 TaxID=1314790 RepID=A0A1Y1Y755_9FUNG|nr:hypothetical protein K493DRAFT_338129 [Basidiobolus meristosporus CBS 931.73]|eukprot:ORX93725.1 hypothetical protein K493DRAFT_338129 [Basidiobolus meristosporus CBS 931.73]